MIELSRKTRFSITLHFNFFFKSFFAVSKHRILRNVQWSTTSRECPCKVCPLERFVDYRSQTYQANKFLYWLQKISMTLTVVATWFIEVGGGRNSAPFQQWTVRFSQISSQKIPEVIFWLTWTESLSEIFWSHVIRRLSLRPSVNFSHLRLLLKNRWANFNQTQHKAPLGRGDSRFYK